MTPRVSVDLARLEANLARYGCMAAEAGVALRAHVKGHRSPQIARRQMAHGAVGVAVHSAAEAQSYVDIGVRDVVVAWPWREPWRWDRFARLAEHCTVAVHVDDPGVAAAMGEVARRHGVVLGARIEVDTGPHRAGVPPDRASELARAIHATTGLRLDGVTGYAALTDAGAAAKRLDMGRSTAELLVAVAQRIRADGLPCPVVTVGGTPTMAGALAVPGVTEVCSGAYALLDGGLAGLGACEPADVAIAVTMSGDAGELLSGADYPWAPGVVMTDAKEAGGGEVTVLPGHVCPVVARRPLLQVVDNGVTVDHWQCLVVPDRP